MLTSLSRHAAVLVLERHHLWPSHARSFASVTPRTSVSAQCPVVVVPEQWRPAPGATGTVVVGIEDPGSAQALTRAALAEAGRRAARLQVVAVRRDLLRAAETEVDLAGARVPVDLLIGKGRLADLPLWDSAGCELLAVARPKGPHGWRFMRHLLTECAVPVLLVDPATGGIGSELVLAASDAAPGG
jgi:hypothetical protein